MNIRDEYIVKTKDYLHDLRKKIDRKTILEDEIKILKSRQKLSGGMDFEHELGVKKNGGYKGIDDLIITTDSQICCLEAQKERIEHYIMMHDLYTRQLSEVEKEIIKIRYLEKSDNSFRNISKKIRYSKSYVARMHDDAIKELAYYIFGENATYA